MRTIVHTLRQQYLGGVALLVVLGGVAAAATGGNLKLGASNAADKQTVLQNTGTGPALQLTSKAGQPPLSVSNTTKVPKLNASLLGGKAASAFAVASSVYTKAQSDAKYAAAGSSYTKAQSDANYAAAGSSYTKAQADAMFAAAGSSYTKTEGDDRYGRVLTTADFTGSSNPDGSVNTIFSQSVAIPGAGIVKVFVWGTSSSGAVAQYGLKVGNETSPFGTIDAPNNGVFTEFGAGIGSAGNVLVEITMQDNGADSQVSGTGKVMVVYFPF